ncbi:March4 [Columba guinea]|nr:March4 [Columba guinea]
MVRKRRQVLLDMYRCAADVMVTAGPLNMEWKKRSSSCISSRELLTDSSPAGSRAVLSVIDYCRRRYVLTAAADGIAKEQGLSEGQETLWEEESLTDAVCLFQGELLSPCRCDGSVKCTHQPCLIKWISERGCWSCELCYYKYHVIAISTKNPLQWQAISLTVIEKVQIAAAILGSLFLIASISWLIWSTFSPSAKWQRQDLLFQICYGMYGFMDIVCIGGLSHLTAWPRSPTCRSICGEEWEIVWRASRLNQVTNEVFTESCDSLAVDVVTFLL